MTDSFTYIPLLPLLQAMIKNDKIYQEVLHKLYTVCCVCVCVSVCLCTKLSTDHISKTMMVVKVSKFEPHFRYVMAIEEVTALRKTIVIPLVASLIHYLGRIPMLSNFSYIMMKLAM